jgi:hypothetical protein
MDIITQALLECKKVEEKFRNIQENPALYGAEKGFSSSELEVLEKLIKYMGEANIAVDAIIKRASA